MAECPQPFITTIPPRGPQYLFSIGLNPEPVSPKENRRFDSNRITVQTPTADTATTITTTITYSASVSMAATKNTIQFSPNYSFFFHLFSEIRIRNNGEINRLVLEDDYHINKGNNNDVIVENGDGNDNGEDNNYDNVNNHDVQMLELEKTLDVYVKKANKSLFKWC